MKIAFCYKNLYSGHGYQNLIFTAHMRHNLMQVLKLIDWNAVDRQHHVAITETGMLGRRARLHILDKTYELSQLRARVHQTVRLQMKSEIGAVHI